YGPTETNVCTFYEVRPEDSGRGTPAPIGRACSGNRVWAETESGATAGPGEEGELLVQGPTVMLGYEGGGALAGAPDRTGDLVRVDSTGAFVFVGRRDHMIKIRGHRVEPGEIETVLLKHPRVRAAAVAVVDERLTAFLVCDGDAPEPLEIKRFCAE